MRFFLPAFIVAAFIPHVDGQGRWLALGLFMGFIALMVREV